MITLEQLLAFLAGWLCVYLLFRCARIFVVLVLLGVGFRAGAQMIPYVVNETGAAVVLTVPQGFQSLASFTSGGEWCSDDAFTVTCTGSSATGSSVNCYQNGPVFQSGSFLAIIGGQSGTVTNAVTVPSGLVVTASWSSGQIFTISASMPASTTTTNIMYVTNGATLYIEQSTNDVWPSAAGGFGVGLLVCGFGWVLALVKKTSGDF